MVRLEDDNLDADGQQRPLWCYAISAKRYCLYTLDEDGEPELVKWSEHGLGHLLNPTDPDSDDRAWMRQEWEGIVQEVLGLQYREPDWLDRPALSRLTISSPELLAPFADLNAGKVWPEQVKPFNFLLVGHVRPFGHPIGVDPTRFQPVAPYEADPTKWRKLPWIDRYSGKRHRVGSADDFDGPETMRLQSYRDVMREFRTHPEAKSADAKGAVCDRRTVGLLRRRAVQETVVAHVGKEANKFEDVEAGVERDPEAIYTEYQHPGRDPWRLQVLPVLRQMPPQELAKAAGLSVRRLSDLLSERARPRPGTQAALGALAEHAYGVANIMGLRRATDYRAIEPAQR